MRGWLSFCFKCKMNECAECWLKHGSHKRMEQGILNKSERQIQSREKDTQPVA